MEVVYLPAQLPLHARLALLLAHQQTLQLRHVAPQLLLGALLAQLGRDEVLAIGEEQQLHVLYCVGEVDQVRGHLVSQHGQHGSVLALSGRKTS